MATESPANGVSTTLAAPILSTDVSCSLTSATGFTNAQYHCLLDDGTNQEIVTATALSGTTLDITRASESWGGSATAYGFSSGAKITIVATVQSVQNLINQTPPTLTKQSNHITADLTLPANTYAVIFNDTFAVGVWLISVSALVDLTTAGNCMIWVGGGGATYTKEGPEQQQFLNQLGYSSISFTTIATITAAGVFEMAVSTDATAAGSLKYTNFTSTGSFATGYVAVKIG